MLALQKPHFQEVRSTAVDRRTFQASDKALLKVTKQEGSLTLFSCAGCAAHSVDVLVPV